MTKKEYFLRNQIYYVNTFERLMTNYATINSMANQFLFYISFRLRITYFQKKHFILSE